LLFQFRNWWRNRSK